MCKFDLCFADLVKINRDKSLNIDNNILLFIYDELRGNIVTGVRNIFRKFRCGQKCPLTSIQQLIKEILYKYNIKYSKDYSKFE